MTDITKTYVFEVEMYEGDLYVIRTPTITVTGGTFDAALAHARDIAHDLMETEEMVESERVDRVEVWPKEVNVETEL